MPSCIASSFSQGDAFISSKPERTTTCTSSPPSRRALRQQSIAVLPPPSTTTRLPIFVVCPKETLASQSTRCGHVPRPRSGPGCRCRARAARRCRRRPHRSRRRAAPSGCRRSCRRETDAEVEHVAHLLVDHRLGQPELRDLRAHHAAGARVAVEHHAFVAERRQVARDAQ